MSNVIKTRSIDSNKSKKKKKKSKSSSADLKVVYISSPMKVKTCASNFRYTVQQLTGKDSDLVDRLMDQYANNSINSNILDVTNEVFTLDAENGDSRRVLEIPEITVSNDSYESPTSSGSRPFVESPPAAAAAAGPGFMFSDVNGNGEGFDGGFTFDEIFGAAGFLLECPLDEESQFC